jgi:hypothetical protein
VSAHQCWGGWRYAATSKIFNFYGNRHPRINDIGICSPVVIYCLQLQILNNSLLKKRLLRGG